MKKRVCILNTGGTIGMVRTELGFEPQRGFLEGYLEQMPELKRDELPQMELHSLDPLLDSANMQPEDWLRIANAIVERAGDFDGFVVVHGTDTMTYTASALSFLLKGLDRPVILTGSQLPLSHVRSDGRAHIITSLMLAARDEISEVCLFFGGRLLRGNRAQKVSADGFVAFASGNLPPLAMVGARIRLSSHLLLPRGAGLSATPPLIRHPEVVSLRLFPGLDPPMLSRLLGAPTEGVVLETYGMGNFPSRDPALLSAVEEACAREVVVVNCTQTHHGSVRAGEYSTGRALAQAGAISGRDITPEAALTKLYVLLGRGHPAPKVRELMQTVLAGEMSAVL